MNIFVGNLSKEVTEEDLKEAFSAFGQVATATVIKEKFTGESRGFGFVEMPSKAEAQNAMNGIKGIKDKMVVINEARPLESGNRGSGGGSRSRGGFGGRNRDSRGGQRNSGWR